MDANITKEIESIKKELGLMKEEQCSNQENKKYREMLQNHEKMPENLYRYGQTDNFCKIYKADLTKEEEEYYLQYKTYQKTTEISNYIRTIKNCVVFFTILEIIAIIVALIAYR